MSIIRLRVNYGMRVLVLRPLLHNILFLGICDVIVSSYKRRLSSQSQMDLPKFVAGVRIKHAVSKEW